MSALRLPLLFASIMVLGAAVSTCTAAPAFRKSTPRPPKPAPSWCEQVGSKLPGWECVDVLGSINVGDFGPSLRDIGQNTIGSCFGGTLPQLVKVDDAPARIPAYTARVERGASGSAGLALRALSGWLPNVTVSATSAEVASVDIRFKNVRRSRISNIPPALAGLQAKLAPVDEAYVFYRHCMNLLCSPDFVLTTEVLIGVPEVTISASSRFAIQTEIGWSANTLGADTANGTSAGYSVQLTPEANREFVVAVKTAQASRLMANTEGNLCGPPPRCGGDGEFCCAEPRACGPQLLCSGKRCLECGGKGDPCCKGQDACHPGLQCEKEKCAGVAVTVAVSQRRRSDTTASGGDERDFDVVAECPPTHPVLRSCAYSANGNTGGEDPFARASGDRARNERAANRCICRAHHDGKSLFGPSHWLECFVTATCADK